MNPSNEAGQGGSAAVPPNPDGQALPVPPIPPAQQPVPPQPALQPPQPPAVPGTAPPAMTLPLPPNPAQPDALAAQTARNPLAAIPQSDVSATTPTAAPQVIDDGDLIEKEWVNKAKQIVEQNRNDPYKQSEELTVFRADYMKKRYNKNIKVDK